MKSTSIFTLGVMGLAVLLLILNLTFVQEAAAADEIKPQYCVIVTPGGSSDGCQMCPSNTNCAYCSNYLVGC